MHLFALRTLLLLFTILLLLLLLKRFFHRRTLSHKINLIIPINRGQKIADIHLLLLLHLFLQIIIIIPIIFLLTTRYRSQRIITIFHTIYMVIKLKIPLHTTKVKYPLTLLNFARTQRSQVKTSIDIISLFLLLLLLLILLLLNLTIHTRNTPFFLQNIARIPLSLLLKLIRNMVFLLLLKRLLLLLIPLIIISIIIFIILNTLIIKSHITILLSLQIIIQLLIVKIRIFFQN